MITVYHLTFNNPVHFGLEGIGQENIEQTVRSDTLWGALIQKWLLLFDDNPEKLCLDTPFTLSSCFPLINGCRYYPAPVGALDNVMDQVAHMDTDSQPIDIKTVKKIKYFAEPLFYEVLQEKQVVLSMISPPNTYPFPVKESVKNTETFFSSQKQRPRVKTDQINGGVGEESFFYCTDQFFEKSAGLFFLASFFSDESKKNFEAALRLLGDSGLGADRSVGRGCFTVTSHKPEFHAPDNYRAYLLLSLYHPDKDEVEQGILKHEKSAYTLVRRSGRAGSVKVNRFRRADCWMLEEGSILPFKPTGTTPCVLKRSKDIPHNVYRNGRAFCLPMGI